MKMEHKDKTYAKRMNVYSKYERIQKSTDLSNIKQPKVNISIKKEVELPSNLGQAKEKFIKNIFIRKLGIERYHLK